MLKMSISNFIVTVHLLHSSLKSELGLILNKNSHKINLMNQIS